jgi:glucose/arabinose dehydrogenase
MELHCSAALGKRTPLIAAASTAWLLASVLAARSSPAQSINASLASDFALAQIIVGGPSTALPFNVSIDAQVGQMTFGPDGRLYVATLDGSKSAASDEGILRFDYSPTGSLTNKTKVSTIPSTGIAFHQDPVLGNVMYITDAVDIFGANAIAKNGVLRRMTDTNGDGTWGGAGDVNQALVNNVPVEREHRMNQLQIRGNSLYTGVGSLTTDGHNEAAYTATISWIQDLTAHSNNTATPNAAGFNETFLTTTASGGTPSNSITPLTSTDPAKLRVHSIGLRNPFGIGFDGDNNLYATMNNDQGIPGIGTPSDLFFKAAQYANYGFPYEYTGEFDAGAGTNRGDGTPYTNNLAVTGAGFSAAKNVTSITAEGVVVGYSPSTPNGSLGPSAAVGGVDFATANGFKLRWQKDAFIGRWSFNDLVAVDIDTGEVVQIATGFNRILEVEVDPYGNILVAEAPLGDTDRARIYRISPNNAHVGVHLIDWNENLSGNWSDRLSWGGDFNGDGFIDPPFAVNNNDRMVPHQWGMQRFAVSISRQVADLQVTLDQNARVELLTLGNAGFYLGDNNLSVAVGKTLTLDDRVAIEFGGKLSGSGTVAGLVENRHGFVQPALDDLDITGNFVQQAGGTLLIDIAAGGFGKLLVSGSATLGGTLVVNLLGGYMPASGTLFDILDWNTSSGTFSTVTLAPLAEGLVWNTSQLYISGTLSVINLIPGDFDSDGDVDGADFVAWQSNFPKLSGATLAQGDADGDGDVDGADFVVWQTNFPFTPMPGRSTVPEPAGWMLTLVAFGAAWHLRCNAARKNPLLK